jgi:hypothetical protein
MADMTFDDPDSDPDSAAMAQAMGFTGFGMQKTTKKRKPNSPPSQTGANNAPLGKRRLPLNLPGPVGGVSGSGAGAGGDGNHEEIDLDEDDDDRGDVGGGAGVDDGGDVGDVGADFGAARGPLGALTVNDDAPATGGSPHQHQHQQQRQQQQQHHALPPRPHHQQQQQHAPRQPGGRGGGGGGPGQPSARAPWWEGEWDPRLIARMIENPWERLERQRGLEACGTWPPSTSAAAARGGRGDSGGRSGGAAESLGEQAIQTTVS